jgi:glycosyltransferase involved in cell wall biosynthesis
LTKVAFWFDAPIEYSGGINYIKNLLYALSLVNDGTVQPYVFFPNNIPQSVVAEFSPYATVVRTKLLERGTPKWFIHRVLYKLFGTMAMATSLLKSHGISIVSHVWFVYKGNKPFHIISWIPDFQYLHLPELFPQLDPTTETARNREIIAQSDMNVLSSYCALEDFKQVSPPECIGKTAVLQFVSQPRNAARTQDISRQAVETKFGFSGKFFFLPNQFWAHKNHMVVGRAVKLLKDRGVNVLVLCTGNLIDFRYKDTPYVDRIKEYVATNGLEQNIRILGLIDYDEVLFLMRNSIAVLNPSKFEGWSSSVEEAKSVGKKIILSRINVHVEQVPARGEYFDPDDADTLAAIMEKVWVSDDGLSSADAERIALENLHQRTVAYGNAYLDILHQVTKLPGH